MYIHSVLGETDTYIYRWHSIQILNVWGVLLIFANEFSLIGYYLISIGRVPKRKKEKTVADPMELEVSFRPPATSPENACRNSTIDWSMNSVFMYL